ncbi:gamma-glutamylcyclotransferase family protein [Halovenus halobia]|uniref:gamma-glutamylcyclotransferase family protein n=1 Tax=Halovenus halobia TaxID=3396622 RepID=UPI003F55B884
MDVFVYGTLTEPDRAADLLSEWRYCGEAVLEGLHCVDGQYPTLLPGGKTDGRILSTPERDALDRYEGVESDLYVRVTVPCAEEGAVQVYVGDPDRLGVAERWPGTGAFPDRVRAYLDTAEVRVRDS